MDIVVAIIVSREAASTSLATTFCVRCLAEMDGVKWLGCCLLLLLVKKNNSTKNVIEINVCVRYFVRFFFLCLVSLLLLRIHVNVVVGSFFLVFDLHLNPVTVSRTNGRLHH